MKRLVLGLAAILAAAGGVGCGGAVIEPGHRGLYFDPSSGLKPEVLNPGYHSARCFFLDRACPRIDDFDVTFSTKKEVIQTTSQEGLAMELHVNVIYRPIIEELYKLDTETGPNYYDEVVGPEFRSAARGVLARHSYMELQKANEKIEDEIEADLRRRINGKHIEVASITMEAVNYAPEIAAAVRAKLIGEQEAARQKAAIENDALKKKLEMEHQAEQAKMQAEQAMREKEVEKRLSVEQAEIDKVKAQTDAAVRVVHAESEAKERTLLAKARAEEKKAETNTLTPLAVMMHAYDALGKLGGSGTTIMLGDFSRTPQFLFPGGMISPYGVGLPHAPAAPATKNTSASTTGADKSDNPYSDVPASLTDARAPVGTPEKRTAPPAIFLTKPLL